MHSTFNQNRRRRYPIPSLKRLFPYYNNYGTSYHLNLKHAIQRHRELHTDKYITNLSTHVLSAAERSLLSKGLSFIPTPKHTEHSIHSAFNQTQSIYDKHKYFQQTPYIRKERTHPFHTHSTWTAPHTDNPPHAPKRDDFRLTHHNTPDNLTEDERHALDRLMTKSDITIKQSDKGGGYYHGHRQ